MTYGCPLNIRVVGAHFSYLRELIRDGTVGESRNVIANVYGPRAILFRNGTHLVHTI